MPPEGHRPNPPANVARVSIEGTTTGVPWANVFWVRNGNAVTPAIGDLLAVLGDILDAFDSTLLPNLSSGLVKDGGSILYYGETGAELGVDKSDHDTGSSGGALSVSSVACGISWKVQARYRGGHPRTYLAGVPSTAISNPNTLTGAFCTAVASDANDFHAAVNAITHGDFNDVHLGTVSFQHNGEWRSPTLFRDYVPGAATVDTRIDTQRRRLGPDR